MCLIMLVVSAGVMGGVRSGSVYRVGSAVSCGMILWILFSRYSVTLCLVSFSVSSSSRYTLFHTYLCSVSCAAGVLCWVLL